MNNEEFVKTLNDYKELLSSNYKAPIWTLFANIVLFVFFSLVLLKTASLFHNIGALILSMLIIMFVQMHSLMKIVHNVPSFLQSRFNLKIVLENKIKKLSYTGKLSEIFNFNCHITKDIIDKNHKHIEKQLVENKSISGDTILNLLSQINNEQKNQLGKKDKQKEVDKLQEEKEALIMADTKIGQSLKEIEQIKSKSNVENEREFKNE